MVQERLGEYEVAKRKCISVDEHVNSQKPISALKIV
jgi:hypothetical protein